MAWHAYQSLLAGEQVSFMEEHDRATIDEGLAPITSSSLHSPQRWNDAYLILLP